MPRSDLDRITGSLRSLKYLMDVEELWLVLGCEEEGSVRYQRYHWDTVEPNGHLLFTFDNLTELNDRLSLHVDEAVLNWKAPLRATP